VLDRKYDILGDDWSTNAWEYSASFDLLSVSTSGAQHFHVLGRAGSDYVVERWKFGVGEDYGSLRPGTSPAMKRKELYRGDALGEIREIGADPERRYLLLVHGSPATVSRVSLPTGTPIVRLYQSSLIPNLEYVTGIYPRQHFVEGRVWILETFESSSPTSARTLLKDHDNDGTVDGWQSPISSQEWNAFAFDDPDAWDGDFVIED